MTELILIVDDNKFVTFIVFSLLALLVYLRASGFSQKLAERLDSENDPSVEADFYTAYGDFERAAQIIRKALTVEPVSPDLVLKLLEIHFQSGNREEFLRHSRFYRERFGQSGHWETICTMGQQLLPGERLFRRM